MDYYEILEINKNATDYQIKKGYRKLALKYHPDRDSGDEEKFKTLSKAYQVLSDPVKRRYYDLNSNVNNSINFNFKPAIELFKDMFPTIFPSLNTEMFYEINDLFQKDMPVELIEKIKNKINNKVFTSKNLSSVINLLNNYKEFKKNENKKNMKSPNLEFNINFSLNELTNNYIKNMKLTNIDKCYICKDNEIRNKCKICNGNVYYKSTKKYKINLLKNKNIFKNCGNYEKGYGKQGDLIVYCNETYNKDFIRKGLHLIHLVFFNENKKININLLNNTINHEISNLYHNKTLEFIKKGLYKKGNLYVIFKNKNINKDINKKYLEVTVQDFII